MNYLITALHVEDGIGFKIKASKTSSDFSMLLPPEEFTRKEMVTKIHLGDTFYRRDRKGKETPIQLRFTVKIDMDQFEDVIRY